VARRRDVTANGTRARALTARWVSDAWDQAEWDRAEWNAAEWVRKDRSAASVALGRAVVNLDRASSDQASLVLQARPRCAAAAVAIGKVRDAARKLISVDKVARAECVAHKAMTSVRRRKHAVVAVVIVKVRHAVLRVARAECVAHKAMTSVLRRKCAVAVVKAARVECVVRKVMTLVRRRSRVVVVVKAARVEFAVHKLTTSLVRHKPTVVVVQIGKVRHVVRKVARVVSVARRMIASGRHRKRAAAAAVRKAMGRERRAVHKTARAECAARRVVILALPAQPRLATAAVAIGKARHAVRRVDSVDRADQAACVARKMTRSGRPMDPKCAADRAAAAMVVAPSRAEAGRRAMTSKAHPSARKPAP
jgi:hypothetical protein